MDSVRHLARGPARLLAAAAILLVATAAWAEQPAQTPSPAHPPEPPKAGGVLPKATQPPLPKQHLAPKQQADGILGKRVYGSHGEDMGLVTDVLVDRKGNPIAAVIDFGGFLGVGTRKIAIDWRLMHFHPGDTKKPVTLSLQKAQLQAAPQYEAGKPAKILGAPAPTKPTPTKPTPAKPPTRAPSPDHGGK